MAEFELTAANDNFDKSTSTFSDYAEMANALARNLYAAYPASSEISLEKGIRSVIHRTVSMVALSNLIQRLQQQSLTNAARAYVDSLQTSGNISAFPEKDLGAVMLEMCISHVLSESLGILFSPSGVTPQIPEAAVTKMGISLGQYSNQRLMQESISKNSKQIIEEIAKLEPMLDLIRKEAQSRQALLAEANQNGN
jgi:hypothetical protein